jgi:hypothetical protein
MDKHQSKQSIGALAPCVAHSTGLGYPSPGHAHKQVSRLQALIQLTWPPWSMLARSSGMASKSAVMPLRRSAARSLSQEPREGRVRK